MSNEEKRDMAGANVGGDAIPEAMDGRENASFDDGGPVAEEVEGQGPIRAGIATLKTDPDCPTAEPLFTLRANDVTAPNVVDAWALAAERAGAPREKVVGAKNVAHTMRAWQRKNGSKVPD